MGTTRGGTTKEKGYNAGGHRGGGHGSKEGQEEQNEGAKVERQK